MAGREAHESIPGFPPQVEGPVPENSRLAQAPRGGTQLSQEPSPGDAKAEHARCLWVD